MVLHTKDGMLLGAQAFDGAVVEVYMGNFNLVRIEGIGIDRETVVLRTDLDSPSLGIEHGLVSAPVPKL
jgi:hypothetical protein